MFLMAKHSDQSRQYLLAPVVVTVSSNMKMVPVSIGRVLCFHGVSWPLDAMASEHRGLASQARGRSEAAEAMPAHGAPAGKEAALKALSRRTTADEVWPTSFDLLALRVLAAMPAHALLWPVLLKSTSPPSSMAQGQ